MSSGCIDFKLTVTYNNNNNKNIRRLCFLNNFGAVILRGKVCIGQSKCGAKNKGTTELWGNFMEPLFFCPHFHGGIQALPCKIMEKYRLCTTKSQTHSFRGQNNSFSLFFVFFFIYYFRDLHNLCDHFLRKING